MNETLEWEETHLWGDAGGSEVHLFCSPGWGDRTSRPAVSARSSHSSHRALNAPTGCCCCHGCGCAPSHLIHRHKEKLLEEWYWSPTSVITWKCDLCYITKWLEKHLSHSVGLCPCLCSFLCLSLCSCPLWRRRRLHAHVCLSPSVGGAAWTLR